MNTMLSVDLMESRRFLTDMRLKSLRRLAELPSSAAQVLMADFLDSCFPAVHDKQLKLIAKDILHEWWKAGQGSKYAVTQLQIFGQLYQAVKGDVRR